MQIVKTERAPSELSYQGPLIGMRSTRKPVASVPVQTSPASALAQK